MMARTRRKKRTFLDDYWYVLYFLRGLGLVCGVLTIRYQNKIGYTYLSFSIWYPIWRSMAQVRGKKDTLGWCLHQCQMNAFAWFLGGCFLCYFIYYLI